MRRGSLLILVFTLVVSILSVAPVSAVIEPTSEQAQAQFQPAEATLVQSNPFKKQGNGVWIIHLDGAPVATYDGGVNGIPGTSNEATGRNRLNLESANAQAYQGHLEVEHKAFLSRLSTTIGRTPSIQHEYFNAANGFALYMTWQEASDVARMDGVAKVLKDTKHTIDTDAGPVWIGADTVWDGSATGDSGSFGEGVLVGILDTGINPANPSFAEVGPIDGYVHTNPLGSGNFLGMCDTDPTLGCNDKLIGMYNFTGDGSEYDDDGHGSHTASTVAGNKVLATVAGPTISEDRTISGVAPHANIIAYDVCTPGGCSGAAILQGIDQAIADGVDVINYSIGSASPSDPWSSSDDLGFLEARAAGIFVAHSAGNEGPGYATVGSPMAPWITHVAATTHNRAYPNALVEMTGGTTTPPDDLVGLGFTSGYGPARIIYAGAIPDDVKQSAVDRGVYTDVGDIPDNALCGLGSQLDYNSPWEPETFTTEIVVCDRGTYGRVEKGANVLYAGASGYVLADDGGGLSGDAHDLPAVHISQADGETLKTWLADGGTDHMGTITGATLDISDGYADIIAGFSSRGPNRSADTIAPSVGAPGVDIIAAHGTDNEVKWDFLSGTSMASPHIAGVGALMAAVHPDWTPEMVESAMMTTAIRDGVVKEDGSTAADPFDFGAGRVDVEAAVQAALVLEESPTDYLDADPALGGDPTSLNLASMSQSKCVVECSWTRTFTSTASTSVDWDLTTTTSGGMVVTVSPTSFTIAPGDTQEITVTANVEGATANEYHFGSIELTPSTAVPDAHLPIAVQPTTGSLPEIVNITTARNAGSWDVDGLEALEITDLAVDVVGLTKADLTTASLVEDPTSDDAYDDFGQVLVDLIDVPAGSLEIHVDITQSDAPDLDLYLGFDENGNGIPEPDTELVCTSASGTALESCTADAQTGQWWILIQNWSDAPSGAEHSFTYATAVVPDADAGNMEVIGPDSVPQLEPFAVSVQWDLPDAAAGDRYYGAFSLGTSASNPGNIGTVPVRLSRVDDDVVKTADVATAFPGDTITYTITVNPNVTNQDLEYTVVDDIPDGLTYVEGSATGGATVLPNGVVEWTGTMLSPALAEMYYEASTPATNAYCDTPFGGYVNLEDFGIYADPAITGDTQVWTAFSGQNPIHFYGDYYAGAGFTDDGFAIFDPASNYAGQPWVRQVMPDAAAPNNVAAMMWNDFEIFYDETSNAGITLATAGPDFSVIEYDDVQWFGGSDPLLDFEIFLQSFVDPDYPEIVYAYDNVDPGGVEAAIGVENAAGDQGLTLADGDTSGLVSDGSIICLDWVGPEFEPAVITYQVTVDDDAPNGTITNEAVHVTDNVGDKAATASAGVEISREDMVPPVISLNGSTIVTLGLFEPYVEQGATALDAVDGDVSSSLVIDSSAVDTSVEGDYIVTYEATDSSGNTAVTGRVVVVALKDAFVDDNGSIFQREINLIAALGITKGCNPPKNDMYCPELDVTRGEFAALLGRALGLTDRSDDPFTDDDTSIFEADIERLHAAGITKGCNPPDNDEYCPDDILTRGQAAAMFSRAFGYTDDGGGDLFIDDDTSVFEHDIDLLATAGVTKGCNPPANDRFCPNQSLSRGQMAAFIARALGL